MLWIICLTLSHSLAVEVHCKSQVCVAWSDPYFEPAIQPFLACAGTGKLATSAENAPVDFPIDCAELLNRYHVVSFCSNNSAMRVRQNDLQRSALRIGGVSISLLNSVQDNACIFDEPWLLGHTG